MREIKDRMKNVEIKINNVHKDLKKEIKQVVEFLDKEDVTLHKRISKIEKQLNLPQN